MIRLLIGVSLISAVAHHVNQPTVADYQACMDSWVLTSPPSESVRASICQRTVN